MSDPYLMLIPIGLPYSDIGIEWQASVLIGTPEPLLQPYALWDQFFCFKL